MKKKYVIELESGNHMFVLGPEGCIHIGEPDVVIKTIDGIQIGDVVINAKPYVEPDIKQIKEEAYLQGLNDGQGIILESTQNNTFNNGYKKGYKKGIDDMWEVAKKIVLDEENGGFDTKTYCKIFGYGISFVALLKKFTASEIIAKIRKVRPEDDKQEIVKVGNEVIDAKGDIGVCTEISYPANSMHILYGDGTATDISLTGVTKTGNDFPEVIELLKKMRGETNSKPKAKKQSKQIPGQMSLF